MPRYFIRLSFKGTNYSGWQVQANAMSVQQKLNEALALLMGTAITTTGCGRTDTGVHAKEFYVHLDTAPITDSGKFIHQLNALLPTDIAIHDILEVERDAHARFDATSRTYEYFISLNRNPFLKEFTMNGFMKPDYEKMTRACAVLYDHVDFSAFSKSRTQVKTNICKISYAGWEERNGLLVFTITADRFLRGMVRAIVGTMINIGTGKIEGSDLNKILAGKNRSEAGTSVAACGLFLSSVTYPFITPVKTVIFPG